MLWKKIQHPCVWFTPSDYVRLRANAKLPFWKTKFDLWRKDLAERPRLFLTAPHVDFHQGSNTLALQAALCHVVDDDDHTGRLISSFIEEIIVRYRDRGPTWPLHMAAAYPNEWVGNQWEGLANNHIVDPMVWFSTAHLYDVIDGKGYLSDSMAREFEQMMGEFHRLCCLHEEFHKLDNNRAAWLNGGSYLSTLFDEDDIRAELCRKRAKDNMEHLLGTILPDGLHYEVGPYSVAALTAIFMSAHLMKNVEGADFFGRSRWGVGMEDSFRAWIHMLTPGSALRFPLSKDRLNHWDTIMGGYGRYHHPELGWAISRAGDRTWVPMFKHWPQGAEFYFYRQPDNAQEPAFLDSHLTSAGIAVLRESWQNKAKSIYFRYGFQGSSHGGGLDKLNIEITCNDEPLISDGGNSEFSHYKNVVLVDGHNQEQCSGKLIAARLESDDPVQFVSALGGFGSTPECPVFHDPRTEWQYWSTRSEECFLGVARMRRTIAFVQRKYFIIRDTLCSLDQADHDYQWLWHSFAHVRGLGKLLGRKSLTYHPKRIFKSMRCVDESHLADRYQFETPGKFSLCAPKASANMWMLANGNAPGEICTWPYIGPRYQYAGSPEKGDGYTSGTVTASHIAVRGKDISVVTVIDPFAAGDTPFVTSVNSLERIGVDCEVLEIASAAGKQRIIVNESDEEWMKCSAHDVKFA